MTRIDIPIPGLLWGDYPEKRVEPKRLADRCTVKLRQLAARFGDLGSNYLKSADSRWLLRVRRARDELAQQGIDAAKASVHAGLLREGLQGKALIQAFGLTLLAVEQQLGLLAFDTQLIAACAVLDGKLAEMATGEGKTLAVALAAAAGAMAGVPVHVITANDYLVERDTAKLQPMYAALGLRVGSIVQASSTAERAVAYACNITYVTAKELVFDYLRDTLTSAPKQRRRDALAAPLARLQSNPVAPPLLRGLCMAIVDEADAIMIDEARTPLILSQRADTADEHRHARQALDFAAELQQGVDFELDPAAMSASLSEAGCERLERIVFQLIDPSATAAWRNRLHREHAVSTALAAIHLYQRERHYLLRDSKVVIIDETTGRVAEGRVWSRGLQQFIELKEACEPSPAMVTLAQLTYQRFFPRYLRLGGLSGTLIEARSELISTYGTTVRRIPLRRPNLRQVGGARLFADQKTLWVEVADRVAQLHTNQRPVLLAADSVAEAQAASAQLTARGLPHAVLHAQNDLEEALVIARAGQAAAITVTTNMAGRGTDIELGAGVGALGGLHVICCQLNNSSRIDRQLAGRAARQGDAGSVETMLSLETALLARSLPRSLVWLLRRGVTRLPSGAVRALARWPQRAEEIKQRTERRRLIQQDERSERQLGFGGASE